MNNEYISINFLEKLARTDINKLALYLYGTNSMVTRTFAAEAMGLSFNSVEVRKFLLPLLNSEIEPMVQEGAIYGLEKHLNAEVRAKLQNLIENKDTSWGVRMAAEDALEEEDNE